ncbi:hypothetical protein [Herbaspirillum frisingense]|uniref:hypothetical protein n=1 Tax=Herbaspirillum frisingense TaxID=92645 RepID=UPI0039B5B931
MSRQPTINEALAETILLAMERGVEYEASELADHLGMPSRSIYLLLRQLEDRGDLTGKRAGRARLFQKRDLAMVAARVQPPIEAKPLTGYDLGRHMRLCEGARKSDTGMA